MSHVRQYTNPKTGKTYPIGGCIISNRPSDLPVLVAAPFPPKHLPPSVDLRRYMTPVEYQGQTNSCGANAIAGAYEFLIKRKTKKHVDVSRLFIYYNGRLKDGCNPHTMQDVGCTLQGVIDGMQDYGCCSEDIWKYYPTSINRKPSSESYTKAKQYRVTNAMQIPTNLIAMKSCLADGYPFTFGLNLFESFHRAATNKGRVPMPESWERQSAQHGYHALVAAGYSDRSKCFIVRNSWGTQWGDKGYCYIPYAYMSNPQYCQDIYVIKRISSKRSHPQKYAASNPNESHDDDLDVPFDHTQFWSQNDSYNYYIGSELTNDPNNFIVKKKYNGIACDFTPFIIWIDTKTDLKDIIERKLETTHKAEFEFCQTFSQGIDYVLQYRVG